MQCDEASNQRTNQSASDEGGRKQQNRHSWRPHSSHFCHVNLNVDTPCEKYFYTLQTNYGPFRRLATVKSLRN